MKLIKMIDITNRQIKSGDMKIKIKTLGSGIKLRFEERHQYNEWTQLLNQPASQKYHSIA